MPLLIGGDTNVAFKDQDKYDNVSAEHNKNNPSCTKEERKALQKFMKDVGVTDQMEKFQEKPEYTGFLNPRDRYGK